MIVAFNMKGLKRCVLNGITPDALVLTSLYSLREEYERIMKEYESDSVMREVFSDLYSKYMVDKLEGRFVFPRTYYRNLSDVIQDMADGNCERIIENDFSFHREHYIYEETMIALRDIWRNFESIYTELYPDDPSTSEPGKGPNDLDLEKRVEKLEDAIEWKDDMDISELYPDGFITGNTVVSKKLEKRVERLEDAFEWKSRMTE